MTSKGKSTKKFSDREWDMVAQIRLLERKNKLLSRKNRHLEALLEKKNKVRTNYQSMPRALSEAQLNKKEKPKSLWQKIKEKIKG